MPSTCGTRDRPVRVEVRLKTPDEMQVLLIKAALKGKREPASHTYPKNDWVERWTERMVGLKNRG